ncbi:MAG: hypothetical protein RIK87_03855 [Fuerstiella sp.]
MGVFALSEALRAEPSLVSQLVRIAIHAMACRATRDLMPQVNWTDDDLARLQHRRYPESLSELPPALFPAGSDHSQWTTDPFDNDPLRYSASEGGITGYLAEAHSCSDFTFSSG